MIKNWFITGDTHGAHGTCQRLRVFKIQHPDLIPEETGIIFLGDVGINWCGETLGGSYDDKDKEAVNKFGYQLYLVRGNHEFRPSTLPNIQFKYDEEIYGWIYEEDKFPNIHYFRDGGGAYIIQEHPIFVIPGAYSVDKNFRLATGKNWFRDEQMTKEEQQTFLCNLSIWADTCYDYLPTIISHTCPYKWESYINYLFMDGIDQENVNKDTEKFLDKVLAEVLYKHWYFGHFHDDKDFRDIRATMLFKKIIPLWEYLEEEA